MVHYCIYCGAALPPDAQLCPRCGRLVPEVDTPPTAVAPQEISGAETEPAPDPAPHGITEPEAAAEQPVAPPPQPPEPASPQPVTEEPRPVPSQEPESPPPPQERQTPPAPPFAAPKYAPVGMERTAQRFAQPQADLLTTGGVLGLVLLGLLPLVGWIVLLVWAFDSASGPNHRALAKGLLLAKVLLLILCLLLVGLLMAFVWMLPPYLWY